MSSLRLSTGHEIPLDGDLLAVLEGLYREVTLRREFKGSFEDMMREIEGLVAQMSAEDRRRYLVESLFLNYNTYESEMLVAYAPQAHGGKKKSRGRAAREGHDEATLGRGIRGGGAARGARHRAALGADDKEAAAPRIRVEPEAFDFGKALPGKTLRKEFTLRNFGDAELVIEGVIDHLRLHRRDQRRRRASRPGGSTQLASRSRRGATPGKLERQVLVRSNDPEDSAVDGAGERDGGEAAAHEPGTKQVDGQRGGPGFSDGHCGAPSAPSPLGGRSACVTSAGDSSAGTAAAGTSSNAPGVASSLVATAACSA